MIHRTSAASIKRLLVLAIIVAAGCSYHFEITAEDLTTLSPRFKVHPTKAFGIRWSPPEVREIEVLDTSAPIGAQRVIWRVTAEPARPLSEILYGTTPQGFAMDVAPQALRPRVKYNLSALAYGGSGGIVFEVSPTAVVSADP